MARYGSPLRGWAGLGFASLCGVRGNLIRRVGGLPAGVVVGRGRGSPVPPAPGVLGRGHAKASGGGLLPVAICARESLSLRRSLWWSLGRFPVGSQWSLRQACNPSSVLSRVLSSSLFLSFVRSLSLSLSPSLSLSLSRALSFLSHPSLLSVQAFFSVRPCATGGSVTCRWCCWLVGGL